MRAYIAAAVVALGAVAGCQVPVKGDASLFQGDKNRTLEARVKVGNDGPGLFVRERLTQTDYKNQSELSHFALTDALYSVGGFAVGVGSRSTAKVDTDNTRNDPNTAGRIDPRVVAQYGRKIDNLRLFVNVAPFWNVRSGADHRTQVEYLGLVGYTHVLSDDIIAAFEGEAILRTHGSDVAQVTERLRVGLGFKWFEAGIGGDLVQFPSKKDPDPIFGVYIRFKR